VTINIPAAPAPATARDPLTIDRAPGFRYRCVEEAVLAADVDAVYSALLRVEAWPTYLPHVLAIDVKYDDGQYQEFLMTVKSETDGAPLRVRSIRNCQPGVIEFFQPEPPRFLAHHGGIWRFRAAGRHETQVEVTHVWNLNAPVAVTVFPSDQHGSTEEKVSAMLAGHSRLTLRSWQRVFDAQKR
jgi:hypothetical protein